MGSWWLALTGGQIRLISQTLYTACYSSDVTHGSHCFLVNSSLISPSFYFNMASAGWTDVTLPNLVRIPSLLRDTQCCSGSYAACARHSLVCNGPNMAYDVHALPLCLAIHRAQPDILHKLRSPARTWRGSESLHSSLRCCWLHPRFPALRV